MKQDFRLCARSMLMLVSLVYLIRVAVSCRCSGDQITWVNKNNTSIRCSPCPPCPPGQEFTLPCGTKVLEGTMARCINCPSGKFSRSFNKKPCVYCRICSKRHVKRPCTLYKNSKCGDCLPGYFKDKIVFDCIECDKCCNDGKDKAPPGCKKVGMCQPRRSGCPFTTSSTKSYGPSTKLLPGKTSNMANKSKFTTVKPRIITGKVKLATKKGGFFPKTSPRTSKHLRSIPTPSSTYQHLPSEADKPVAAKSENYHRGNQQMESENTSLKIALSVICSISVIACVVGCVYYFYFKRRENRTYARPTFFRSPSYCSTPVPYLPEPTEKDRTLRDFFDNGFDVFEDVCVHLNRKRKGMYDFDRIGNRLGLSPSERQSLLNCAHDNPTKELIEKLNASNPRFTVKQFAEQVKSIKRMDVYEMLEPFFEKQ